MLQNKNKTLFFTLGSVVLGLTAWFFAHGSAQAAQYQYVPTSQNLIQGTDKQATSATAAAATGVNMG